MVLDIEFMMKSILPIASKAWLTIYMSLVSMVFATLLAALFAYFIMKKVPILSGVAKVWNSFIKGIPIIIQLYVVYYTLPNVLYDISMKWGLNYDVKNQSAIKYAIIALSLNYASYMTDVVISSLKAVDAGQLEACWSVGMTTVQAYRRVIIPQAFVVGLPNAGNQFVALMKATSMAYFITVMEVLGKAKQLAAGTYKFFEAYILAAVVYWVLCIISEKLLAIWEAKIQINRKATVETKSVNVEEKKHDGNFKKNGSNTEFCDT